MLTHIPPSSRNLATKLDIWRFFESVKMTKSMDCSPWFIAQDLFSFENIGFNRQSILDLILCPHLYFFLQQEHYSSFSQGNFTYSDKCQMTDFVPKFRREGGMCAQILCTQMIEEDP